MPHPEPPADLPARPLLLHTFRAGQRWWRIHRPANDPVYFGKGALNRFDAPKGEFGVLYAGADAHCAFIETFGHATGTRFVTEAELDARALAVVRCSRALQLVDLRGEGLAQVGADAALPCGFDYALAQRWARAFHDHPRKPDGIAYPARHDPSRTSIALFDQAAPNLKSERLGPLSHPRNAKVLGDILTTYRFGLV